MSSTTIAPIKENLFNTYLINQDENKDTGASEETPTEKPAEPTASWSYEPYSPKRVSFHTIRGKIKRYFA